jgi:hypothetical protein
MDTKMRTLGYTEAMWRDKMNTIYGIELKILAK